MRAVAVLAPSLIGLLFVISGCGDGKDPSAVEFRVPVTVREIGTADVEDRIIVTGTLRAPETVSLMAETAGLLRYGRTEGGRRLAEGDRVRAGQTIGEILGDDVRLAARTEATERRYKTAQRDHDSSKALYEDGLITELDFRRVEDTLTEARLEWERSLLTETRTKLTTPIGGVIQRLGRGQDGAPFPDGQYVQIGFVLAQIAPVQPLIAEVDLVGADLARVAVGQPARVRHLAFDDRTFDGKVRRLAPSIDPTTRTFKAEIRVDNSERLLRPGMFVEATVVTERREGVAVVPREAVAERSGSKVVFILQGQKVAEREVVLGLGDDDIVEIRTGVDPGERVVVRGLETLSDDVRVRVTGS